MANLFDRLQDKVFDTTTKWFGYDAEWHNGIELLKARVQFNKPTIHDDVLESSFDVSNNIIEYKKGDFDGLYEAVRTHEKQVVKVNNIEYLAMGAIRAFDGKTYKIRLIEKE